MFGLTEIYTALNKTSITNLLSTYGTGKGLFIEPIIPENFTGTDSINAYLIAPINGGLEYDEYEYSINCRASSFIKSVTIAQAVFTECNRIHGTDSFTICKVLQTIPPADITDVYNTPVNIKLLKR